MQRLLGMLLAVWLAACSSTPTTYHSLAVNTAAVQASLAVSQRIASLGVGDVKLPTLLDREGMVLRQNATNLSVSDTHLWGGQLEDEFLAALTQQLQARLPQTRVQTIPWELSQTPQYQIALKIDQFDGVPNGNAVLRGTWQLQQAKDGKWLATYPIALQRAVTGKTVDAIVQAQSQLVADLAEQVVAALAVR